MLSGHPRPQARGQPDVRVTAVAMPPDPRHRGLTSAWRRRGCPQRRGLGAPPLRILPQRRATTAHESPAASSNTVAGTARAEGPGEQAGRPGDGCRRAAGPSASWLGSPWRRRGCPQRREKGPAATWGHRPGPRLWGTTAFGFPPGFAGGPRQAVGPTHGPGAQRSAKRHGFATFAGEAARAGGPSVLGQEGTSAGAGLVSARADVLVWCPLLRCSL